VTPPVSIGAMSSSQVILGELLSSRARLRFPGYTQAPPSTPVRQANRSERHTGIFQSVSLKGVTPKPPNSCQAPWLNLFPQPPHSKRNKVSQLLHIISPKSRQLEPSVREDSMRLTPCTPQSSITPLKSNSCMEVLSFQILTASDGAQTNETKELLYRDVLIFF